MPPKPKFSNPALQRKKTGDKKVEQFHLAPQVNSFKTMFDLQKLEPAEESRLQGILEDNWLKDTLSENEFSRNLNKLKSITEEIKSISRQGAILVGERIVEARRLLKDYREGTFTLWLEATFGSRQSGYNMLAYYELFMALPDESLKMKYKNMSQRAAYCLANRRGDLEIKCQLIAQHSTLKSKEFISIIQEKFSNRDYRSRRRVDGLLARLLETVDQLAKRRKKLTTEDLEDIKYAKERIQEILKNK